MHAYEKENFKFGKTNHLPQTVERKQSRQRNIVSSFLLDYPLNFILTVGLVNIRMYIICTAESAR